MAFTNPNKPAGLSPVATLSGSDWTGKGRMYAIPTSDSTYNYFPGDLVSLSASAGGDVNGLPLITMCTAGSTAVGVIQAVGINPQGGPYINPNNLALTYAPVTKTQTYYALVLDDPNIIFEIQEGGTGTNLTTSVVGLNANILLGSASTAATPTGVYVSQTTLTNASAPTTTNTLNLKIVSFAQRIDNHFVTSPSTNGYQKWWVLINNHQYRTGITAP
jgi:hypothetical protein